MSWVSQSWYFLKKLFQAAVDHLFETLDDGSPRMLKKGRRDVVKRQFFFWGIKPRQKDVRPRLKIQQCQHLRRIEFVLFSPKWFDFSSVSCQNWRHMVESALIIDAFVN